MFTNPVIHSASHTLPVPRGVDFRLIPAWLALALIATTVAWTKPPARVLPSAKASPVMGSPANGPRVDSARVKRLYLDGEFDAAIAILEDNLKETRPYNHGDSVFILKHLGVMYAAQYDTREKGKYFMHRLLEVEPTAKIMDMYASDMIYMIFKNIQAEYEQTRTGSGAPSLDSPRRGEPGSDPVTLGNPRPDASETPAPRPARDSRASGNGRKWIWAGAAVATVAVGVGAYVMMNEEPSQPAENEVRF